MNTITIDRAVVEQALEALEYYQHRKLEWDYSDEVAITALRAALAEPVQEPYTDDVTRIMREAGMTFHLGLPHKTVVEQMTRVVDLVYAEASIKAAQQFASALAQQAEALNLRDPAVQKRLATQWGYVPAAAQAEPVEPVAVVATQSDVWRGYNGQWAPPGEPIKMVQMLRDLPTGTLLYTAPPQRKPLTEGEIVDAVREADLDWQKGWTLDETQSNRFVTLARAVEQASWEKNHGQA